MGMSKGLKEFVRKRTEEIEVELRGGDAVRLRQPSGIVWMGFAGGLPSGLTEMNPEVAGNAEQVKEAERLQFAGRMRYIVAAAITAVRVPSENGSHKWDPVKVIAAGEPDENADPPQISIDVIDNIDDLTRCFNALAKEVVEGGEMSVTEADGFPGRSRTLRRTRRAR